MRYLRTGQTIDASLSPIPSDMTVSFDPAAGKVDYNANAGIASIDATVTADAPLFGRAKRDRGARRGAAERRRASASSRPAARASRSRRRPAVGMIQAAIDDGVASATPLAAGRSGVVMKDVPSEFSLFGRLFNVSSASVTTAGSNLDATLTTGPLPNNELQDLDLDVTFDTPGDAVADPAHIVGFVQDLPATLTLSQHGSTTTYDAGSIVPKVTLDARNLPGGSSGGSLDGGLHNAVGTLTGVPTHFEIAQSPKAGVTANGAFTRADLEAWDHGPQNAAFPEDDRNKVALNTRDGRLHVQARVFALSKVLLGTSLTTSVETAFGSTPAPLDIAVDGGTGGEPLDLDVGVTDLPTSSTFTLSQLLGMKLGWTAATPGTDVTVKLSAKDVGADLTITDLPSFVDICVGGGLVGCSPKAPSFFSRGSDTLIFPNAFTAVTNANGTITMGGKVCLPPTDDDGEALSPPGTVYGACLDGTSPNRIEIDNLRLKQQRLEFGSGDTTNEDEDGDPMEDGLLKLWLEGDNDGIRVDNMLVRNDTSDSSTIVRAGHTRRAAAAQLRRPLLPARRHGLPAQHGDPGEPDGVRRPRRQGRPADPRADRRPAVPRRARPRRHLHRPLARRGGVTVAAATVTPPGPRATRARSPGAASCARATTAPTRPSRPTTCMSAGTSRQRMISASSRTAIARPRPNSLITRSGPSANEPKTTIMISAAAVMTRPVVATPLRTASDASPVRSHSSRTRDMRNIS